MIPEHSLDSDDWLEPVESDDENEELDQQDRENHENEQESIRAELIREFPEEFPGVDNGTDR
jgi:hypothetical protein